MSRNASTTKCLYDYAESSSRPALQCVTHPQCPRRVVLWRKGLLEELGSGGRLTGTALSNWEKGRDGQR